MKSFDDILTDANFQRIEGEWIPNGDFNQCLLDVLRGMYDEIRKKIDDPF